MEPSVRFIGYPSQLQMSWCGHKDTNLILATGGNAMVKAAYSSGTPAIGVGPGNGQPSSKEQQMYQKQFVDFDSKPTTMVWFLASEQSIIVEEDMKEKVVANSRNKVLYFVSAEDAKETRLLHYPAEWCDESEDGW